MENLRATVNACTDSEPWFSGVCNVPNDDLLLYFKGKTRSHAIDIPNATDADLKELCDACEPASFGLNKEAVLDDNYRKALKMDKTQFAINFPPDRYGIGNAIQHALVCKEKDARGVVFDLYKLNVYGKGSFFKSHRDTLRGKDMFGSLVVVLPTKHEGGNLVLQHNAKVFNFKSAQLLKDREESAIAFVAFYSDVDHAVELVTAGNRLTLTYNLYYAPVLDPTVRVGPKGNTLQRCTEALKNYLRDETVFPEGGYLGFGLQHTYPLDENRDLEGLHLNLKGGDALLYDACEEAGLDVSLRLLYRTNQHEYMLKGVFDHVLQIENLDEVFRSKVPSQAIRQSDTYDQEEQYGSEPDLPDFEWVTEATECTTHKAPYVQYGNEPEMAYLYGWVNLIVSVPEPSKRELPK